MIDSMEEIINDSKKNAVKQETVGMNRITIKNPEG